VATISGRTSAGPAMGVDYVEEMAVAKESYLTDAAGKKWSRVPSLDALVAKAYNSVEFARSKHGGKR
jgi:hypothetical protein